MEPLISIVIPVKNGDRWLKNLFESLSAQTLFSKCEIIVVDSGSTDNSLEICKQYNVSVYQIEPETFNHGLTRNLGVQLSKGKYILLTVQDALPEKNTFLEQMVECFLDENVSAVCGLQIVPVSPVTNPFDWYRPISIPEIYCYHFPDASAFDRLSPDEKRSICSWDDVCAMYRKEVIRSIPFQKIAFGEDMAWCQEALRSGHKICYNPIARVTHYHSNEGDFVYRRMLTEFNSFYSLFRCVPERIRIFKLLRRIVSLLVKEKEISFGRKLYWIGREIRYRMTVEKAARHFMKYLKRGSVALERFNEREIGRFLQAPKH